MFFHHVSPCFPPFFLIILLLLPIFNFLLLVASSFQNCSVFHIYLSHVFSFSLCSFSQAEELSQYCDRPGQFQVSGGGPVWSGGRKASRQHQMARIRGRKPLDHHRQRTIRHGDGAQRVPFGSHARRQWQGGDMPGRSEDTGAAMGFPCQALCGM